MKPEKQLILFLWVPTTIAIFLYILGDLLWAFGNSCLITDYYTSRFSGPLEANLWLIKELGIMGVAFGIACLICYYNLTLHLFKK